MVPGFFKCFRDLRFTPGADVRLRDLPAQEVFKIAVVYREEKTRLLWYRVGKVGYAGVFSLCGIGIQLRFDCP